MTYLNWSGYSRLDLKHLSLSEDKAETLTIETSNIIDVIDLLKTQGYVVLSYTTSGDNSYDITVIKDGD